MPERHQQVSCWWPSATLKQATVNDYFLQLLFICTPMLTTHTHGRGVNTHRQDILSPRTHRASVFKRNIFSWFSAMPLLLGVCWLLLAQASSAQQPESLDEDYHRISTRALQELATKNPALVLNKKNINGLVRQVSRADASGDSTQAILLIAANMPVLQHNIGEKEIAGLARLLFKHQAIGLAKDLLALASRSGDGYAEARLTFEYARYLASQQQWQDVYSELKAIDINNALSQADADEAQIMLGAALQQQKKHRAAVEYFARLKPDSEQYRIAQLNTAVAYIRQDWWTDAHIAIKNALKVGPSKDELANRLYTLLGFSQLQHGFYRDARESFRHVHLKSGYANRALLGLGVAALHQEDFIGALNAFNHLKKKDEHDISVAESYLLSAFSLVQLKQNKTASASYTEAITYYERLLALYSALSKTLATPAQLSPEQRKSLAIELRDHSEIQTLAGRQQLLNFLQSQPLSANTAKAVDALALRVNQAYVEQVRVLLDKKHTIIDSYLSQSRFGLARLFDSE